MGARILIGTPCYGGMVSHLYMQSVLKLMAVAPSRGLDLHLALLAHDSLITRSRNTVVAQFLDMKDATHLLFIDADIGFEPEEVFRLLDCDVELAAGMYPLKVVHWPQVRERIGALPPDQAAQAGLNYVGIPCTGAEREEKKGFVTGRYAGTGFMLIRRSVIEKLVAAYPETKYKMMQTYPIPKNPSQNQYNLFDCVVDPETGTYLSEDFTFCWRWRKIGGRIWLDQQSRLTHVGVQDYEGNAATRLTSV